jgi:hypothetical protein
MKKPLLRLYRKIWKEKRRYENRVSFYDYTDESGKFDYDLYKSIQQEGNKRKIECNWADKENISYLCDIIRYASFGICHGTRRGLEQKWFSETLGCDVIGTEISDTASDFPRTIQWDFHVDNPDWHRKADFVYSNSLDHAYDPATALRNWMKCLNHRGVCIVEHSSMDEKNSALDPFGVYIEVLPYLIIQWGEGKFCVTDIHDVPRRYPKTEYQKFLFIRNNAPLG